jgi:Protein of unknown function (DUF3616)
MLRELIYIGVLCALPVPSIWAQTTLIYSGAVDGSAGVALDNSFFVAASDEDNILRIYDSQAAGLPLQQLDVSSFLGAEPASPEADIEGAARVGNRIYWITSHARNKDGDVSASRQRFFATDILTNASVPELVPAGKPCKTLLNDLAAAVQFKGFTLVEAAKRLPEDVDGLNIEGLAATSAGHLLIGFRNPVPGGRALIVPLLNPDAVIEGQPVQLGQPILLDLGGLGIRDMAQWQDEFVIIAGPYNNTGQFKLFTWTGGKSKPQPMAVPSLKGFNPEAAIIYPDKGLSAFELLCDDSSRQKSFPRVAKGQEKKRFRGIWVRP